MSARQVVPEVLEFVDTDDAHNRTRFQEADPFVRQRQCHESKTLGKRDVQEDRPSVHPDRFRRLDLTLADGLEAGPEDFRLVSDRVDRQSKDSDKLEQARRPWETIDHEEVDEPHLDEERRASDSLCVACRKPVKRKQERANDPAADDSDNRTGGAPQLSCPSKRDCLAGLPSCQRSAVGAEHAHRHGDEEPD